MNREVGKTLLSAVMPAGLADQCESLFADTPDTYTIKCMQLYQQHDVIARVVGGAMSLAELAEPIESWNPTEWDIVRKKHEMQINATTELSADKSVFTIYKCRKCKASRTSVRYLQTRRADEPVSVFVTCVECAFEWRLS